MLPRNKTPLLCFCLALLLQPLICAIATAADGTTGNRRLLAIRINFPDRRHTHSFDAVTYYFAIIPYSNTGYAIDYKLVPEPHTADTASASGFAKWIATFTGAIGSTGAGDDIDLDRVSNLLEYAYSLATPGVSPEENDAHALLPTATVNAAGQMALSLRRADTLPANISITVEGSKDLGIADPWADISAMVTEANNGPDGVAGTGSSIHTFTQIDAIGSGLEKRFMRVVVREN